MASRDNRTETRRTEPRLYLVTPPFADPSSFAATLRPALAATDVAAVLVRLAAADDRSQINRIKAIAPLVQEKGTALLLAGHADIVARAGADGAHLDGIAEFEAALGALKPSRIAGCGGLGSRHDAMLAAESGADYVMFGEPDAQGWRPSFDAVLDRIAWWAEVFESPCIGFAASLEEIDPITRAGSDFIAVGDCIFADARGVAAALADAANLLARAEAAA